VQGPPAPAPAGANPIEQLIAQAAQQYNIDPAIFRAMLVHESGLNPNAIGPGGEIGIGQFMPATAAAFKIDPRDPKQAIPAAALFMRQNLNQFGGDYRKALGAYASGPHAVASRGLEGLPGASRYADTVMGMAGKGSTGPIPQPGQPPGTPLASVVAPGAGGPPAGPPQPAAPPASAALAMGGMPLPGAGVPGAPPSLADAFTQAAQRAQKDQQAQTGIG
jgi:hypothetical protein